METRADDQAADEIITVKVKIFIVEYTLDGKRTWHQESLSSNVAYALSRELAKLGRRPTVRRIDLSIDRVEQLLRDYESRR